MLLVTKHNVPMQYSSFNWQGNVCMFHCLTISWEIDIFAEQGPSFAFSNLTIKPVHSEMPSAVGNLPAKVFLPVNWYSHNAH